MKQAVSVAWISLAFATGCLTRAGGALQPIQPVPPPRPGAVEETIGDFEFTLEGGKMVTSTKMGRELNEQILDRWKEKGYIESYEYVKAGAFTGKADYNVTLSGSQYGESSIAMQIFSGLTLLLLPYTVDTKLDLQFTLEEVGTGQRYSAEVADSYHTTVELLLFLAAPVALRGQSQTFDNIADHLYEQLRAKGAFGAAAPGGSD